MHTRFGWTYAYPTRLRRDVAEAVRRSLSAIPVALLFACSITVGHSAIQDATNDEHLAAKAQRISDLLDVYYNNGQFQGTAIVAVDGDVILRKSFGLANIEWDIPNIPDTKYHIASHGKQFTATIILQLAEENLLDLQAPISRYIPEFRKDIADRITIHHLLTHTSGMARVAPEWEESQYRDPFTLDDAIRLANKLELEFEPGARSSYSNLGFNLLAAIVQNVTNQPYEQVLHERILKPLGMHDTGLVKRGPILKHHASNYNRLLWGEFVNAPYMDESFAVGAGGLYSTVDDMLKWHEGLFGDQVLTQENKALMFERHIDSNGYGCGVGAYVKGDGSSNTLVFGMGGTNGAASVTFRLVDDRISIILLGNIRQIPQGQIASNITNILVDISVNPIPVSSVPAFYSRLMEEDPATVLADYRLALDSRSRSKELVNGPRRADFPPQGEINQLGYQLLGVGRVEDAIRVFQFNVAAFPESWNAYDSLGEAYELADHHSKAIESYRKSVEMNPANTNGIEALRRLDAK